MAWNRPDRDISYRTRSRSPRSSSPPRPRSRTPPRQHKIDKDPIDWTCRDVYDWLKRDPDYERYANDFEIEGIDGVELEKLTCQDLSDTLGVKKRHRPQLIMSIRALFSSLKNYDSNNLSNTDSDEEEDFPCTYEVIAMKGVRVRETIDTESASLGKLYEGTLVEAVAREGRRLKITEPKRGWVSIKNSSGREMLARVTRGADELKEESLSGRDRDKYRDREENKSDEHPTYVEKFKKLKMTDDTLSRNRRDDDHRYRRDEDPADELSHLKQKVRRVTEMGRQEKAVLLEQANLSENELQYLSNKLELTSEDVEELKNKMQNLKDKIRDKDDEMEKLRDELKRSKERRHVDDIDMIREELRLVQEERDDLTENHTDLKQDHKDQKDRLENLLKKLETYEGRRDAADNEYKYMEDDDDVGRVPYARRRLSSDEEEQDHFRTPGSSGTPKGRSSSSRQQRNHRTRGNDNFVETGVDEDYDDREDSFKKSPSRMKSSSPEFDDSWPSARNSPRHSRVSETRTRYDDDEDMNDDERRISKRGKEDFAWFIRYDGKGKPYYYNSVTRSKRKDKPGTLDSKGGVKIHDPVILCEHDGIWYKAQLIEPDRDEYWWVQFDCGKKREPKSIHREHIRKWVAWLEEGI